MHFRACRLNQLLLLCGLAMTSALTNPELHAAGPVKTSSSFFDRVHRIRITLSDSEVRSLRREGREYVRGQVEADGQVFPEVGIHLKGSLGSFQGIDDKPGFTLAFERFARNRKYEGLGKIHLNNSAEDPTYACEKIGSAVFLGAGVPAARVTHAVVELNQRPLGLYVLVEGFDPGFLASHFPNGKGEVYETDLSRPQEENASEDFKKAPGKSGLKQLKEAAGEPDPHRRWQRLESALDLDRFVTFLVIEVLLGHRDGYGMAGNNFRIFDDRETKKETFLPHGMDQLFGPPDLPWKPRMAGMVAKAVMETPEGAADYEARFQRLYRGIFQDDRLGKEADEVLERVRPFLKKDETNVLEKEMERLKARIQARKESLAKQLADAARPALVCVNGVATPGGTWRATDPPTRGRMDEATEAGASLLRIAAGSPTSASWRSTVRLGRGRYRFEAEARVSGVNALNYGKTHGAGLRVGSRIRGEGGLLGSSDWKRLSVAFEVTEAEEDVELICELRANDGEAWFRKDSVRIHCVP